jgi:hypothetical protein
VFFIGVRMENSKNVPKQKIVRWKCQRMCCMELFWYYISKNFKSAMIKMHRSLAKQDEFIETLILIVSCNHIPCAWPFLYFQYYLFKKFFHGSQRILTRYQVPSLRSETSLANLTWHVRCYSNILSISTFPCRILF